MFASFRRERQKCRAQSLMFPANFEAFARETIGAWYGLTERDVPAIMEAMRQWTYNKHSLGRQTTKRQVRSAQDIIYFHLLLQSLHVTGL